jgi:hypothetical protein
MMPFLRKSKFPMINIAFIITIIYQNRFLLWSDVVIFRTIHYLGQWISVLNNSAMPSLVYNTSISYSPVLYTSVKKQLHPKISKVHWTWFSRIWHNILTPQATYGNRMDLTIIPNNWNPPPQKKKKIRGQTPKNILTIFDNTLLRRWSYVFNIIQTLNLPGRTMKFSPGLG